MSSASGPSPAVLLTGADGFLGRRLRARLEALGRAVLTEPAGPCGAVVHLAGPSDVAACAADPAAARRGIVDLTAAALDDARRAGARRFLFASSGAVYGDRLGRPAREDDPLPAPGAYASLKREAERLVAAAAGLEGVSVRLANLYGDRPKPGTVVADAVAAAAAGGPVRLRSLAPVRDFLHVDDAAEAFLCLLSAPSPLPPAVNAGSGRGVSVRALAEAAARAAGLDPARAVTGGDGGEGPASSLILDSALLARLTGWAPAVSLDEGIARAVSAART